MGRDERSCPVMGRIFHGIAHLIDLVFRFPYIQRTLNALIILACVTADVD